RLAEKIVAVEDLFASALKAAFGVLRFVQIARLSGAKIALLSRERGQHLPGQRVEVHPISGLHLIPRFCSVSSNSAWCCSDLHVIRIRNCSGVSSSAATRLAASSASCSAWASDSHKELRT